MRICSKFLLLFLLFSPTLFAFDLEGHVRLDGKPPASLQLEVEAKHHADCGEKKISPKLKVFPEGGVANVAVWVEGVLATDVPASKGNYTLDQIHCEFSPHVQLIPKGAELKILNSDGFLHNVRAFDETALMLFNDAMPNKGQVLKKRFDKPGRILLRCGLHHWMYAIAIVQDHPYYALTDETGYFKISDLPDGVYRLKIWHESLGELETEVRPDSPQLELVYPALNQ